MRVSGFARHNGALAVPTRLGRTLVVACQAWLLACSGLSARNCRDSASMSSPTS